MTWHNVLQFTQASASKPARPTYKPCALKQAAPNSQLITVTLKLNFTVCALWSITKRQMEQVDLSRIDLGEYVVITHTKTSNAAGGQPLMRMHLWWCLSTMCLLACQARVTTGNSSIFCVCVMFFKC